jgi:hypothetical protein
MSFAAANTSGPDSGDKRTYSSPVSGIWTSVPLTSLAAETRAESGVPALKTTVSKPAAGLPGSVSRQAFASSVSVGVAGRGGAAPDVGRCAVVVSLVGGRTLSDPCLGTESVVCAFAESVLT